MSDLIASVVVPHYEDLVRLDLCLSALSVQTLPRDRYEIIVADNMSPSGLDRVTAVVAGRARIVSAAEKGAGPARNAGVAAAVAPILAFTDADCVPERGWVEAGVAALASCDFAGGAMRVSVDRSKPLTGAEAFELVFAFDNRRYVEDQAFSVTANLFCRRDVFDRTGPFKVGVSEDVEWCQRAGGLGFRIGYAQGAVVAHPARDDWPALVKKWRRMSAEQFALASSRRFGRVKWAARSLALLPSIIAHAPRVFSSDQLATTGERTRALGTLARLRLWRFADAQRLLFRGER